jgi:predicted secreted hydrolase
MKPLASRVHEGVPWGDAGRLGSGPAVGPRVRRRHLLLAGLPLPALALDHRPLRFPRDFGAHPESRTEWWYLTGALSAGTETLGFQVTFFRSRTGLAADSPSAFAARQLLFAHAALTDLTAGRLLHDQRIARSGFGIASAAEDDTRLRLRDWQFARSGPAGQSTYATDITGNGFALSLRCTTTQPVLLQGDAGWSRKGPQPEQASRYYSQPQLAVTGTARRGNRAQSVQGTAWLDHEWSDSLLDARAVGWDWIGMNLADGSALTAFRLRSRDGGTVWTGGSLRRPGAAPQAFEGSALLRFEPLRHWTSPATGASYPVRWRIGTPAGVFEVRALLDAQELDSRSSTGSVYWEGLSELLDEHGRQVGRGYLEMTGYAGALEV